MNSLNKAQVFKKIYYVIFFTALSLGLLKIYDKLIDGFYISRVYGILPQVQEFDLKHNNLDLIEMDKALKSSFKYLSSGSQCFVFLSEDGKYVLKLFKNYRWKTPYVFRLLPNLPYLNSFQEKIAKTKHAGILKTYNSAKLSYTTLKDETGLIYLQLNIKPQTKKEVTLYNRLKKKYSLDLSQVPFALQKYATPVPEVLLTYKVNQNLSGAKKCIDNLLEYAIERRKLKITDSDPHFINNFGYINNKPVSLDIGGLLIDPKKDIEYFFTKEVNKISKKLLPWLHKNYPELETFTKERIEHLQKSRTFEKEKDLVFN